MKPPGLLLMMNFLPSSYKKMINENGMAAVHQDHLEEKNRE